jgi:hypothetical protein
MSEDLKSKKKKLLEAAEKGVDELIKVLKEPILTQGEEDISADKMKNAAQAKKLAFFDALEMLQKIEDEKNRMTEATALSGINLGTSGFAESRAKGNGKK